MSNDVDVSNSIGGNFKSTPNGVKPGDWRFTFQQNTKTVSLDVQLNCVGAAVFNLDQSQLTCDFKKQDLNMLIQWLYAVKSQMPDN